MTDKKPQAHDLNALYSLTKDQLPPPELDQKILEVAQAQQGKSRLSSVYAWQRVVSVAAVMVFTFFIFFEVEDERQVERFDEDSGQVAMPQALLEEASEDTFEMESDTPAALTEPLSERQLLKQPSQKAAKKTEQAATDLKEQRIELESARSAPVGSLMSDIVLSEDVLAEDVLSKDVLSKDVLPEDVLADDVILIENDSEAVVKARVEAAEKETAEIKATELKASGKGSPEEQLAVIEQALEVGDHERAKVLLERFKADYPTVPVPEAILEVLK